MIVGYAQNGSFGDALLIFRDIPQPNMGSWNAIIVWCPQNGVVEKVLDAFSQMQQIGNKSNQFTFSIILSTCDKIEDLQKGMNINLNIIKNGME